MPAEQRSLQEHHLPSRAVAVMLVGLAVAGGGALYSPAWADIPPGLWRPPRIPADGPPQPRREAVEVVALRQGSKVILELAEADNEAIVIVVGKQARPAK